MKTIALQPIQSFDILILFEPSLSATPLVCAWRFSVARPGLQCTGAFIFRILFWLYNLYGNKLRATINISSLYKAYASYPSVAYLIPTRALFLFSRCSLVYHQSPSYTKRAKKSCGVNAWLHQHCVLIRNCIKSPTNLADMKTTSDTHAC